MSEKYLPLPSSLKLFSKEFKVFYKEEVEYDPNDTKKEMLFGKVDLVKNQIEIILYPEEAIENVWHSIFHEVYHIIKEHTFLTFTEKDEEKIVDNTAV
jgi:hypothetical protein